jgi:hypothetical protein
MTYFRELPNVEYQSPLNTRLSSDEYIIVKNLFRREKLRDDLQNVFTLFNKYEIKDGSRPDTVAKELYNSSEYDWVVLISAGITNIRDQWPLSDKDLYDFCFEIYGSNLNQIHHYETIEVKDSENRLILPSGKVVDGNFTIPDPQNKLSNISPPPVVGISNYEYEVRKNNEKRTIYVLKPGYLKQVIKDMRTSLIYDRSSEYVNETLIKTENTRNTIL